MGRWGSEERRNLRRGSDCALPSTGSASVEEFFSLLKSKFHVSIMENITSVPGGVED